MEYYYPLYRPLASPAGYQDVKRVIKGLDESLKGKTLTCAQTYVVNILENGGSIAVPRGNAWFLKLHSPHHTRRRAIKAQDALCEILWTIEKGYRTPGYEKGFASVLHPTERFWELFVRVGSQKPRIDTSTLPDIEVEGRGYRLHKNGNTILGSSLPSDLALKLALRNVHTLNHQYFSEIELDLYGDCKSKVIGAISSNVYLTRIFNKEPKDWNDCGRFYQKGSQSYMNLPAKKIKERQDLLLNGEETAEPDFKSLHLNLLLAIQGIQNQHRDSYLAISQYLTGFSEDSELADAVKMIFLIALNNPSFMALSGAITSCDAEKGTEIRDTLKERNLTVREVLDGIWTVYPELRGSILRGVAGLDLMNRDSDLMERILLRLMNERILALPVHDSLICKRREVDKVSTIMKEEYKEYTGYDIWIG